MTPPLISFDNITQTHSGRTVLEIDKLDIMPGSITGLAGPNGSGKSTLLRLMAFLSSPASGQILFQGAPVPTKPNSVHRQVTLLVQEPFLLKRTVYANIAYGLRVRRKSDIETKVFNAMNSVGLPPETFAKRHWFELSGGEAQRVALAARLVLKPKALLLDEPTASLDTKSATLIREAALAARDEYGASLVIASHDMAWLNNVSDRVLNLDKGRILNNSERSK